MARDVPVKIECRRCLGDGFMTQGVKNIRKVVCSMCEGRKHLYVSRWEVLPHDVVLKR